MITSIRLQNFRSYSDSAFEFEPGATIIVGSNASGKTNLLEAVYLICSTSFFKSNEQNSVKTGKEWAKIDATTNKNQTRTIKLKNNNQKIKKTLEIEDTEIKKIEPGHIIPVTLFEPNQLYQLTTSPEMRRSFLDNIINQINPSHNQRLKQYKRALYQRNHLLKQKPTNINEQIFAWNIRLSDLGGSISEERNNLISKLNDTFSDYYSSIADKKHQLSIIYDSKINPKNYASDMLKKLDENKEKDIIRGFTSVGPHRDDLIINMNDQDLRNFMSRGETRTALLALKRCEASLLEEKIGLRPILLFDDVFSELDGRRRKALTNFLKNHQTLITTTDADIIEKSYAQKTQLIKLNSPS